MAAIFCYFALAVSKRPGKNLLPSLSSCQKQYAQPMEEQKNNPLHGITLEQILVQLVDFYGWEELGYKININSFNNNPTIKSSLTFLRKTPWAREKVERLYVRTFKK